MKTDTSKQTYQKKFDFSAPRPRPFLSNLPARIDVYEEGVAHFFRWRTGLDYYATIDQIVDFIISIRRTKIVDLLTDTAAFALRLADRKAFSGKICSLDTNVTLLERAKQRAAHMNLLPTLDFRQFQGAAIPLPDAHAEVAVSIFDFHRQPAEQFLGEAYRILAPDGHLIVAEMLEPKTTRNRLTWTWKKLNLRYVQKNPSEAEGVYFDREEIIRLFFAAGFRQIIIQGLKAPVSSHSGVFSMITATK